MDNFFWSANIDCKKPYFNFSPPYNLRITNASLHFDTKSEGKQILQMILDGKKHPICTLSLGGVEQAPLNLFFYAKSNLYFTAKGSGKISICGNFIPDEEEDYEAEYSSTSDDNENFNENTILQEFFGDDLLDSSDDEEYQQQYSDDDFNNYNNEQDEDDNQQPKIQVIESDEEEEINEKIKQKKEQEKVNTSIQQVKQQQKEETNQNQKKKRKHSKEEEKGEGEPKKKEKTKKAKKNINKDNDLYLLTPKNKGVLLDSDYRRSGDFFTKDLTGSHKGRIEGGSLIHLYCDIYDNNYVKLVSSESSHPVSFRSNVNKVVDFIDKTIGSMRWSCLKIIKIPTLKMPPHRREFFSKYFNITVQSTDKISYIYLKVCPLQKATN